MGISDTGSIMLKLKNISIALLFSAVFVNSKTVRSVSKDECAYACGELDSYFVCKDGNFKMQGFSEVFKAQVHSICGTINFDLGDDQVKNAMDLGGLENYTSTMPSFFGDLTIVVPKSKQECLTFTSKMMKKMFQTAYEVVDSCKCPGIPVDASCNKADSPFQTWLKKEVSF